MPEQSFRDLVVLFPAGLALILLAGMTLVGRRWPAPARYGAATVAAGGSALIPVVLDMPSLAVWPVAVVAAVTAVVGGLGSARLAGAIQVVLTRLRRPAVQAAVLALAGVGLAAGGLARFEAEDQRLTDQGMDQMLRAAFKPPTRPVTAEAATTDGGRAVALAEAAEPRDLAAIAIAERELLADLGYSERVIRLGPANDACNCHGWVFTGGRYWVNGEDVERILTENGYQPVSDPRPGDLAIYRNGSVIGHTAVVRTAGDGGPILVEGKWGWMGVFLHPVGDSCYGTDYTFYRSHRDGHILAGLGSRPASPVAGGGQQLGDPSRSHNLAPYPGQSAGRR